MSFKLWGNNKMQALTGGSSAPDFDLRTTMGSQFSLRDALARGPVVAAFFKVSCPVCQFAFPLIERLYRAHDSKNLSVVGISQNDVKDTQTFMKQFGITFPVLLDEPKIYPVSNAYGLTNVPTLFWIAPSETVEISSVGWMRKEFEEINRRASELSQQSPPSLFKPGDNIPEFRAG